ncbi:MAG: hypothetical protein JXA30_09385 [Deltaproteobacteria bacterium]|nr:hypothetical protein [Deltaproteobacteria bacterium]
MSSINHGLVRPTGKVIRFISCAIAIQILLVLFSVRATHAEINRLITDVGSHMMRYPDARYQDQPRRLYLNGVSLRFASGSTAHSLDRVLDFFQSECHERNRDLSDQIDDLIRKGKSRVDRNRYPFLDGVWRHRTKRRGFVACLDTGADWLNPERVAERIRRFLTSGDLAYIGQLRYVIVERGQQGTSFVAFWTEGSANLLKMLPTENDAPGLDLPEIPRPPESRRLLSAWEKNLTVALMIYSTSIADSANFKGFYQKHLQQAGWRILFSKRADGRDHRVEIIAEKNGKAVTLGFYSHGDDGGIVTMSKMN